MKVIIAGGRGFSDYELLKQKCDFYFSMLDGNIEIVSGKCRGADKLGERYANEKGYPIKEFPAQWDTLGKRAGHVRNGLMALYADALIAFWDGVSDGTADMITQAEREGLNVKIVRYGTR
jgi:hypothetical protein